MIEPGYAGRPVASDRPKNVSELMKVRDVIKQLEADGWHLARTRGSHRQYKHPTKSGLVTIAGKPGDDVAPGTLNSVLKQAGLKG